MSFVANGRGCGLRVPEHIHYDYEFPISLRIVYQKDVLCTYERHLLTYSTRWYTRVGSYMKFSIFLHDSSYVSVSSVRASLALIRVCVENHADLRNTWIWLHLQQDR